ncbi:SDR family NAD(P)-dependent oxidoreductase [Streptomyces sp. NPDC020489]|uniref:SDR family NAD(P)-dependent oxidoreductase n=1 Tax=Streptomyces sp. NPDC020489 TaxID=3365077 RepID=UPI0037A608F2
MSSSEFRITEEDIRRFAAASGDANPLHTDAEYAARTSFGRPIAHGALVTLHALAALPARRTPRRLTGIAARFHAPAYPGQSYRRTLERTEDGFRVRVMDGSRLLLDLTVTATAGRTTADAPADVPGPRRATAATVTADRARPGRRYRAGCPAAANLWRELLSDIGAHAAGISVRQALPLGWASYLAGMELPGRDALVSGLTVHYDAADGRGSRDSGDSRDSRDGGDGRDAEDGRGSKDSGDSRDGGEWEVASADARYGLIDLAGTLPGLGRVEVRALARRTAPRSDVGRLRELIPAGEPGAARTALVVGGSRGLGASLTQALALAGYTVYLGHRRSADDAAQVRADLGDAADRVHLLPGDAADPAWAETARDRILGAHGHLDVLILNAFPPVTSLALEPETDERAADYLRDALQLARAPLAALLPALATHAGHLVAVSTAWVDSPPPGWSHYVSAKLALEGLVRAAAAEHPELACTVLRPGRMPTAFSDSVLDAEPALTTEQVAATVIARLGTASERGQVAVVDHFDTPGTEEAPQESTGRLVVAATFTTDPLHEDLRSWTTRLDLGLEPVFADYGQVFQQLLDPAGDMGRNRAGCNLILLRVEDWLGDDAARTVDEFARAAAGLCARSAVPLLVLLCPDAPEADAAATAPLRTRLAEALAPVAGAHLLDADEWRGGGPALAALHDPGRLRMAHIPYTAAGYAALATAAARVTRAALVPAAKVLVLDCDNTLWRGVLAEDGPHGVTVEPGHRRLHEWALELRARGVLLCLASKNEARDVAEVLRLREDMPLGEEHLTARRVDWEPKSANLVSLARELDLGLDSFVMIDDNPVEIAALRAACPQVLALTCPADPAALPAFLDRVWAFDRLQVTAEDRGRATFYEMAGRRRELRASSATLADFIRDLDLRIEVREAAGDALTRVAQLTQRTNQFTIAPIRRQVSELRALLADDSSLRCRTVRVSDRFGDYGVVGAALLRTAGEAAVLETFLMSCRVLGKGVEHAFLAHLAEEVRDACAVLRVVHRPSERNAPARRFLDSVAGDPVREETDGAVVYELPIEAAAAVTFRPDSLAEEPQEQQQATPVRQSARPGHSALVEIAEQAAGPASDAPVAAADAPAPTGSTEPSGAGGRGTALARIVEVLSRTLGVPAATLDAETTVERLRPSSLAVVDATVALERWYGELPATLLYEHRTLGALADTLAARRHPDPADTGEHQAPVPGPAAGAHPTSVPDLMGSGAHPTPVPTAAGEHPTPAPDLADADEHPTPAPAFDTDARYPTPVAAHPAHPAPPPDAQDPIAVIGLAGRYPGARDIDELWHNLLAGRDCVGEVPAERWDHTALHDPDGGPGRTYSRWAALIDGVDEFDSLFFGISPAEAELMDPRQRLFLETAHQALQHAGYTPAGIGRDTGVYVGAMANDYGLFSALGALTGDSPYPWAEGYQIANRVSYLFDFTGPSLTVDTACSASGTALELACGAVRRGEVGAAVAGGVNLVLHPARHVQYAQMGMLSRTGRCHAFGAGADGFVLGEGVGAVVLKRLDRALADGDHVHGVIRAAVAGSDGRTNGFTVPSPTAQAELVRRAHRAAGVEPGSIGYVEAHGSGTALGDPIEVRALTEAFGAPAAPDAWCGIGSIKSNIGHLESAAAVAGLTKVLLQLRHRTLAPTLHADPVNPRLDLARTPFLLQSAAEPWQGRGGPLRAGLSSFGAGGVNVHLVVEEAPTSRTVGTDHTSGPSLVVLSGRDEADVRDYAGRLRAALLDAPDHRLADIAFTLQVGRPAQDARIAFPAADRTQFHAALELVAAGRPEDVPGLVSGRLGGQQGLGDLFGPGQQGAAFLRERMRAGDLTQAARLWVHGAELPWADLAEPGRRRVPLPPTRFAPVRHWLPDRLTASLLPGGVNGSDEDRPAGERDGGPRSAGERDGESRYETVLYRSAWVLAGAAPVPVVDAGLLVVTVGAEVPESAPDGLPAGVRVVRAADADVVEGLLDPGADRIVVVDVRQFSGPPLSLEAAAELPLALARWSGRTGRPVDYAVVCGPGEPAVVALDALGRSLALEGVRLRLGRVEVADGVLPSLSRLLAEALGADREVRLDGERRWTPRPEPVRPVAGQPSRQGTGGRGAVVITGGAGGLGRLIARHLVERHRVDALVLLGRSPASTDTERLLADLTRQGARAQYARADITDEDSLRAALDRARELGGGLRGIVHAAGVLEDAPLAAKTALSVRRVLAPKTDGTLLLDRLTSSDDLDFLLLTSSFVGWTGNAGQCDYAAANRFLDAFAEQREQLRRRVLRHGRTVSAAWPLWREGGMHMPPDVIELTAATTGLRPLTTEQALRALDELLTVESGAYLVGHGDQARISAALGGEVDARAAGERATGEAVHERVAAEVCALLKLPAQVLRPDDRFGDVGMDSVQTVRLVNRLNEVYGLALTPVAVYEHPTVGELSRHLTQAHGVVETAAPAAVGTPEPPVVTGAEPIAETVPPAAASHAPSRTPEPPADTGAEPIAVIGMAGRFPGAEDVDAFWTNLLAGRDCVTSGAADTPGERVGGPVRAWADGTGPQGGFLADVDAFDAEFFGISPREAALMDPQQRLFLQASWHAIEDSGRDPRTLAGSRTGVYAGATLSDYTELLARSGDTAHPHLATGNVHSVIANRVSHQLDLRGPSEAVDTACSSSLVALQHAVTALRSGDCDLALAGGVNVLLSPTYFASLTGAGMLSPTGRCHTFDRAADGYVRGEGVAAVLLKPLARALADGDPVHAVLRGIAVGHGGRAHSLTAPRPSAQADVVTAALRDAGVPGHSLAYVETHGTGTALGDPIEIEGLRMALGGTGSEPAGCVLGAVKAAIGHLESASGMAGLIAVVQAMRHRTLPGTPLLKEVNPHIDLSDGTLRLATAPEPWERRGTQPRRAGVSSFGFGGTNAHAVVEEAPPVVAATPSADQGPQIVTLSATDDERLRAYAARLYDFLADNGTPLADLAHTSRTGRTELPRRLALACRDTAELRVLLADFLAGRESAARTSLPGPLEEAVREWTAGGSVDWSALFPQGGRRVRFPLYPFTTSRRYGPPGAADTGGARSDHTRDTPRRADRPDAGDAAAALPHRSTSRPERDDVQLSGSADPLSAPTAVRYEPALLSRSWEAVQPVPAAPTGSRPVCVLLLGRGTTLPVTAALPGADSVEWIVVRERSALPRLGRDEHELDPDDGVAGRSLGERLRSAHPRLDVVADLTDLTAPAVPSALTGQLGRVGLLQALVASAEGRPLRLLHLTSATGGSPWGAARMATLVRSLGAEYSHVSATTLTCDTPADHGEALLALVTTELALAAGESEIRLSGGRRLVPRLIRVQRAEPAPVRVEPLRSYLITGGTGGLGMAAARRLAERGARRLALLGLRPLPPRPAWTADSSDPRVAGLLELERMGVQLLVHSGELTDAVGLRAFLGRVREELGPLGGVLHCAGSVDRVTPAFVHKDLDSVRATWRPKGEGTLTLLTELREDAPEWIVLYSSLSAALPELAVGIADYAAGNAVLDAVAEQHSGSPRILSVAWGSWAGAGMGEVRSPRYAEHGFAPHSVEQGLDLLEAALASGRSHCVAAAVDPAVWPESDPAPGPEEAFMPEPDTDGAAQPAVAEALARLLARALLMPVERIGPDTHFTRLGVDSILVAAIVAQLEELVGESLSPSLVLEYPTCAELAAHLCDEHPTGTARWMREESGAGQTRVTVNPRKDAAEVPAAAAPARETRSDLVAVIGAAGRYPGAPDLESFWQLLRDGRSGITEVPASRWDHRRLWSPQHTPGRTVSKWGGFLDGIEEFDPEFFEIDPADASHVDPLVRLSLETVEQTLRDAGYSRADVAGRRISFFMGSGTSTYGSRVAVPHRNTVTGLNQNFIAAHAAHVYDLRGPHVTVDSACSSSLTALQLALRALAAGDCEAALVGGGDLLLDETPFLKLSASGALSPDGACHVFDAAANGIVLGEGVGAVLLKPLDRALADGDRVHAVIEACLLNNDGRTMGLTTPNPQAQEELVAETLAAAGVGAQTVTYVEAHGTGTMIGDPMELQALTRAFRRTTDAVGHCAVGSVKSNMGHLLMAAGMAGLHKVMLSLVHGTIPPTLHCERPNPRFAFDTSPFRPALTAEPWTPDCGVRRAGLSAFGFGGTNAHVLLRELLPEERERYHPRRTPLPPAPYRRTRHWLDRPETRPAARTLLALEPDPSLPTPSVPPVPSVPSRAAPDTAARTPVPADVPAYAGPPEPRPRPSGAVRRPMLELHEELT